LVGSRWSVPLTGLTSFAALAFGDLAGAVTARARRRAVGPTEALTPHLSSTQNVSRGADGHRPASASRLIAS